MTNQQGAPEAPKGTASDGKTELFNVPGYPLMVRAVDFNRLHAENERLAALVEAQQLAPSAAAALPEGWVPLVITHEGQYPEEVAYGPQVLMDRLGKWLRKYFDHVVASKAQPSPTPQADSAPAEAVQRIVHLRADRERRVYVAGPMTGLPEYNFPLFNATAARLRSEGWHVENPAEHGHVDGAGWSDYLRWDISRIATCGAIYLLPGWSKSKGATLEVHIAGVLGLQVLLADGAEAPQADSPPAPEYVGNGMFKGETIQKAAEHWANWCDVRCMTGLSEFLRVVAARAPADSVTAPASGVSLRDEFEAHWRRKYAPLPMNTRMREDGRYGDPTIQQEWEAWQAATTPPTQAADSVTAPVGGGNDDVDAVALARYKVVPAHESMFHRFAVVAGDGKQQLYLGRETECQNMARKFAGAFLDGAFYQSNIAPTPPASAADSVLEDAARLLESQHTWLTNVAAANLVRSLAARKQGANHD